MPSGSGDFPNTRWSLVLDCRAENHQARESALAELCSLYWYPLYAFVRRSGHSALDAEDLTQGFFCQLIGNQQLTSSAEQSKGRLRTYLLRSLQNFIINEWRRETAEKRGGAARVISIDTDGADHRYADEPYSTETPEVLFEKRWATEVMDRAFEKVRQEYDQDGKPHFFESLKNVFGKSKSRVPYSRIAADLEIPESTARVAAFRLRKRVRQALRAEIADTVATEAEIDEEMAQLQEILLK